VTKKLGIFIWKSLLDGNNFCIKKEKMLVMTFATFYFLFDELLVHVTGDISIEDLYTVTKGT
jgi:hypothetical protein